MGTCPTYEPPFGAQLQSGGATGSVDCMAWAGSRAIAFATCGSKVPSGRTIRLQSSEPRPDPMSPGLNIRQVADVARDHYNVHITVRASTLSQVTWSEYERRRNDGQGCIIAIGYSPIADSKYDAGRGFRGNHALFESHSTTIDSLADGRATGVWEYDGTVYTRSIIRAAAGKLDIGNRTVVDGYVWAGFTVDKVPDYRATVPKGTVLLYTVENNKIVKRWEETTGGFSADVSAPKSYTDNPSSLLPGTSYYLSKILSGSRQGDFLSASKYVREA